MPTQQPTTEPHLQPFTFVREFAAAAPADAERYFLSRLAYETDPADVYLDLSRGKTGFVVADFRATKDFEARHIPGAINLPWRSISAATTEHLSKEDVMVTYCWGDGCNASTKAAARLAALGFRVKDMIGGLDVWVKERNPVEGTLPPTVPVYP